MESLLERNRPDDEFEREIEYLYVVSRSSSVVESRLQRVKMRTLLVGAKFVDASLL